MRNKPPHDFDLTTDALPDQMLEIFRGFRIIETGIAHGTLTVISGGHPIEITTHRTDGAYTDSRHPDSVYFTDSLEADLARRDFTVNAMAWSEKTGLVDPFSGKEDLKNGILRAVGDAKTRFCEDALRILRCFRFASQLNFEIEEKTAAGAADCASRLSEIAVERIFSELTRMLIGTSPQKGLWGMAEAGCVPYVFFGLTPDLQKAPALHELPPEAPVRLAALLHGETPEALATLVRRWHAPNAFSNELCSVVRALHDAIPRTPYEARRFVCTHFPHFEGALLVRHILTGESVDAALSLTRAVKKDGTAVEIRRLAVNGREIQEKVGVRIEKTAALLVRLQDLVWQEPSRNRKGTLLDAAVNICKQENWL